MALLDQMSNVLGVSYTLGSQTVSSLNDYTQWYTTPIGCMPTQQTWPPQSLYDTQTNVSTINQYIQQYFQIQITQQVYAQTAMYRFVNAEYVETEAERIAREEREVKRLAAADRAEELLITFLEDEHRESYKVHGHFDVEVKGRIFRIHKGRSMNITEMDRKGEKIARWCAHPELYVPDADTMLAQYLMLKNDERKFLEIANKHRLAA